jgi:Asp-tRNA(Asn)/Glu-tRNA(Gln) amidotransferase A subunit family amidase
MKEARNGGRPNGRLIPAVEYLRSQRIRMMMMMKLAEATANVDVYVVGANPMAGGAGGRGAAATATGTTAPDTATPTAAASEQPRRPEPAEGRPQTPTQRHFAMANLACYPAINVPNGFLETGSPTNVVIYGRPFGEMEVIALAKAYQDAAGFHTRKPTAIDTLS